MAKATRKGVASNTVTTEIEELDAAIADLSAGPPATTPASHPDDPGDGLASDHDASLYPPEETEVEAVVVATEERSDAAAIADRASKGAPLSIDEIVAMARGAITAADHHAVSVEIAVALNAAKANLRALEAERPGVILSGRDFDDFRDEVARTTDLIDALQSAHAETMRKHRTAVATEATAAIEARAATINEEMLPALVNDWQRLYSALEAVLTIGNEMHARVRMVEDFNFQVNNAGRKDLHINLLAARQAAVEAIVSQPFTYEVEQLTRQGEWIDLVTHANPLTGEVLATKRVWQGESEDHFELRRGNARARASDRARQSDPFPAIGDKVEGQIEALIFALDPHQAARNRLLMRMTGKRGTDGAPIFEPVTGSSLAPKPKPQFGPYHNGYVEPGTGRPNLLKSL